MKEKSITRKEVSSFVQAIYWNLRVYLHRDFNKKKFDGRDNYIQELLTARRELTTAAEHRFFGLSEFTTARYRFQPHVLHPAPSLIRGSREWLRRFLPKFYELYLEDPEKYGHLTLTPIKVFRSHISRNAVPKWETRKIPGLMEHRYARLTTERSGRNAPRFENMMMTTRRIPNIPGYGAAAALRVINPVGSSTIRTSFFSRSFSTNQTAKLKVTQSKLLAYRAELMRRQTTTETQALPHADALVTRNQMKGRAVARARAQELVSAGETGVGAIDLRLVRAKSPRNAEYLQRVTTVKKARYPTSALMARRDYFEKKKHDGAAEVYRDQRLFFAKAVSNANEWQAEEHKDFAPSLAALRARATERRYPALLKAHVKTAKSEIIIPTYRRLFTKPNRAKARNLKTERILPNKRKSAAVLSLAAFKAGASKTAFTVMDRRSILHFRKASNRSVYQYCAVKPVLVARSVQMKNVLWNRLKKKAYGLRLAHRLLRQRINTKAVHPAAKLTLKRAFAKLRNDRREKRMGKNFRAPANKVLFGRELFATKRALYSPAGKTRKTQKLSLSSSMKARPAKQKVVRCNFRVHARNIRKNQKSLSAYAAAIEQEKGQTLFNDKRPQLWNQLTQRWMKKFRLLKGWLKNVKYALKQKTWVKAYKYVYATEGLAYDSSHAIDEVLFKATRLRLRKLEWRESDEKFYRKGLKNAFTFHPRERANARWLEALMYRRSLYNLRRGEYRRHQFPREQKSKKWLQRFRKLMYRRKPSHMYIKGRRWPLLRMYSQRLHRSAFHIRNSKVALKRFRKLTRRKPNKTGFEKLMTGFGDRLDVNLMLLNIAPTTYWAREMAPLGLLRVNGTVITDPGFRFQPGDYVEWVWEKIKKLQTYFKSPLKKYDRDRRLQNTTLYFPGNFDYSPRLRSARYLRLPRPEDLLESARINERMFRWNQLDSGRGK